MRIQRFHSANTDSYLLGGGLGFGDKAMNKYFVPLHSVQVNSVQSLSRV